MKRKVILLLTMAAICFFVGTVFADEVTYDIADLASNITDSFENIGKLMVATSYLAGFGFVIAAIFKFKQHKDNPTQIPMGTPIAMLVIGVALIFFPSFISPAQKTIFKEEGKAGGFKGKGVEIIPGADET